MNQRDGHYNTPLGSARGLSPAQSNARVSSPAARPATPLRWDEGWSRCAVAGDPRGGYTIYAVERDGRLLIAGTNWKDSRPAGYEPSGRGGWKQRSRIQHDWDHCYRLESAAQAMRIAEEIQRLLDGGEV